MSTLTADQQALVARAVAALRAQGWPAGRALRLLADRLPPGPAREALGGLATDLEAGRTPAPSGDPFLTLLAQGDRAGPDALRDAVLGVEAERRVRGAWAQAIALPAGMLAFAVALLTLGAWVVPGSVEEHFRGYGGTLPGLTDFALDLGRVFRWVGPVFFAVIVGSALGFPAARLPGIRAIRIGALLRRYAAGLGAGLSEEASRGLLGPSARAATSLATGLALDRYEAALVTDASAERARALASELEAQSSRAAQRLRVFGSGMGVVVTAGLVVTFLLTLYALFFLPMFTMSGSIK